MLIVGYIFTSTQVMIYNKYRSYTLTDQLIHDQMRMKRGICIFYLLIVPDVLD